MNVLIIEDERPASDKLSRLLSEIDPAIKIVEVIRSVEQAINWFVKNPHPELIFMDIQLEDGISFEIFENCRIDVPVIFTTAYDEYTLKAFKVNSVDYLLKPVAIGELEQAIHKFRHIHYTKTNSPLLQTIINQLQPQTKKRFLIKIGEHYKSIPTTDIYCFYILERSTFILTHTGKSYPVDYSLDNIEQLIDPKLFFRVNRNFIINFYALRDVIAYSSSRLKVIIMHWDKGEEIIVSRERVNTFKKWMDHT